MDNRTKWVLGVAGGVAIAASAIEGSPRLLFTALMLVGFGWLAWRGFVAFILFTKPLRDKLKPVTQPFNAHVADTMHRSGLGKFSDAAAKFDRGVYAAVDCTQKNLDERSK